MVIVLGGVFRPARSVIPQTDISSIDGQKSWSGLTRVNWINAFLPTMRRPFTGNNMKICRIKSAWRSSIGGSRRAFKQRPLGLRGYWGGLGPMLYSQVWRLTRAEISCERSIKFNLSPRPLIFRVSGLLVAVYSHNLVAVINCDHPSPTREPRLPGCRTSRLIESQVSINYQGVLPDCICSGLDHHPLPSYPGHHQGQIGQGENKAKSPKLMLNGAHPISRRAG